MIPTTPQEYEHKNCVVVPLAFFDKLMRCYYGNGPRDGWGNDFQMAPQNPSTEVISDISKLKDTTIETNVPFGFEPKGYAKKKIKAEDSGTRHHTTTKKSKGSSKSN